MLSTQLALLLVIIIHIRPNSYSNSVKQKKMKSRFVTKIILSLPFSAIEKVLTVKMDWDSMGFLVGNLSGNQKI
jgi:hypothetical protein